MGFFEFVAVVLIGMGIVLYAYADNMRKALGCIATMAGVLIFGAGAFLYWVERSLGYGTPSLNTMMIIVGIFSILIGIFSFRGDDDEPGSPREGPDQDGT